MMVLYFKIGFLIIQALSLAGAFLFKKSYLGLLIPIVLWICVVVSFFVWRSIYEADIQKAESAYRASFVGRSYGDTKLWEKLQDRISQARQSNLTLFYLLGAQTVVTLIAQVFGYARTGKKKLFWWTRAVFIVLTIVWFILATLLKIVPNPPLI
jgi:hypothetical protein